jgi:hypothetical protein
MAFNPFAGFAKYKRFWMATTLILVMITFVLCSGQRGDLADKILGWARFGGTPVVQIDGTTYYRHDFETFIRQRKVANDFMRTFTKYLIDALSDRIRTFGEPKDDAGKQGFMQLSQFRDILTKRLDRPKYFDDLEADSLSPDRTKRVDRSGPADPSVKANAIIDFRVWLAEADRLRIQLLPEHLEHLIDLELFKTTIARGVIGEGAMLGLETKVLNEVARNHGFDFVTPEFVRKSLENEYRVRIAQLCDTKYQLRSLEANFPKRLSLGPDIPAEVVRAPMTPNQLWDFYQEHRKEFDVALLPLPVAEFAKEIPEPEQRKLEDLFEKHKKQVFDPSSDQPGFKIPHQIRVQYASADQNSPFFKRLVRTNELMASYPIGSFVPQMPLATALRFASAPLVTTSTLQIVYDNQLRFDQMQRQMQGQGLSRPFFLGATFASGDMASPMAAWLAREQPVAIATYIGDMARPDTIFAATPAYLAVGAEKHPEALKAGLAIEARRRGPLYATLVATGAMPTGFAAIGQLNVLADERAGDAKNWPFLPLPIIEKFLLERYEQGLAAKYVNANMSFFKKKLEEENIAGKPLQVQRLLERYGPRKPGAPAAEGDFRDLGLEIALTEKFYDRYSIKDAPELKPLMEAYERYYTTINQIEGRESRPETILKDEDFWKLFFDGTESFAIATGKYNSKPWPPVIKLGTPTQLQAIARTGRDLEIGSNRLDDLVRMSEAREPNKDVTFNLFATSNRPFLFWKTDEKAAEVPDTLADVKDRVAEAWKIQQARETKVLPFAKKLAEQLLAGIVDYATVLKQEPKFGGSVITFDRLAPIFFDRQHFGAGIYTDYKLRRGAINYPHEDTVKHLLALNDPSKLPIKTGIVDLDRLNAELFEDAKAKNLPSDKYVQVLTNKPRDTYYVAVVQFNRGASALEFYFSVLPGAGRFQDFLFDRAQQKIGADHYRELILQLRVSHGVKVLDGAKDFVAEGGQ